MLVVDYLDHLFSLCQFHIYKENNPDCNIYHCSLERITNFHVTEKNSMLHLITSTRKPKLSQIGRYLYYVFWIIMQPVLELELKKDQTRGPNTWLVEAAIEHPTNLMLELGHPTP